MGGADSSKSYDASTFFREFYQPSRKADKKPPPPELKGRVDSAGEPVPGPRSCWT